MGVSQGGVGLRVKESRVGARDLRIWDAHEGKILACGSGAWGFEDLAGACPEKGMADHSGLGSNM